MLHLIDQNTVHSNAVKKYYNLFKQNCLNKLNLFLWWQSWILRSNFFSLQCHMIL